MYRRFWLPALLVLCVQAPCATADETELEGWQKRILRTLERVRDEDRDRDSRDRGSERGRSDSELRRSLVYPERVDPGASAAANEARARYGGRPLAVIRGKHGYRVRLLLDGGRVVNVDIED